MPIRRHQSKTTPSQRRRWRKGSSHHPAEVGIAGVPLELSGGRRERRRRGGPRTPLPLLPLIAACAGIGIAYVSQTAHGTQTTYQATALTVERDQLRHENAQLSDELGRLRSAERIVAAAQQLGMRPAGQWVYAASAPAPVVPAPQQLTAKSSADGVSAVSRVIASFRGTFNSREPQAP